MAQHKQNTTKKGLLKWGAMPFVIALLVMFFGVRAVDFYHDGVAFVKGESGFTFAQAWAEDDDIDMPEITSENDNVFAPPPELPDRSYIDEMDYSDSEIEILQSLAKRREDLRQKEAALQQKEALLAAAEKQLEAKMVELGELRSEIENLLGQQQEEQEARINSLVRMYETMKAKDAARIFDTLEMDVLISVMGRMSERRAAPILAEMNSDIARTVTIKLAEQKKLPEMPE